MHSHLHTPQNMSPFPPSPDSRTLFSTLLPCVPPFPHTSANPLAPTDCESIMIALDECHARGFLYKAVGGCNEVKREVNRCLGRERAARSAANRAQARQSRREIEQIWKQCEEGGLE